MRSFWEQGKRLFQCITFLPHWYACCNFNCDLSHRKLMYWFKFFFFFFRHIFLGFTKCGRYVLSYTSDYGEDDDFSFYIYHLYWWEFNLHSRLKQVKEADFHPIEDLIYATSSLLCSLFSELWCLALCVVFACFFSLDPSCPAVCRRGNLQRSVPDCLWVAQRLLQDCHLWF